jgi:hypothetical protein
MAAYFSFQSLVSRGDWVLQNVLCTEVVGRWALVERSLERVGGKCARERLALVQ